MPTSSDPARQRLVDLLVRLAGDDRLDGAARGRLVGALATTLVASARRAGGAALFTGRWLADVVVDVAPHLPVRDLDTLRRHHGGRHGDALASALIAAACRTTAGVGAAGGALGAIEYAVPPMLLSAPVLVLAETLAVVAVELKLVAELHEVYGVRPPGGRGRRGAAYVTAWSHQRGIDPLKEASLTGAISGTVRRELRQRLVRRVRRNLTSVLPFFVGALAGAELNRRETRRLGDRVVAGLRPG